MTGVRYGYDFKLMRDSGKNGDSADKVKLRREYTLKCILYYQCTCKMHPEFTRTPSTLRDP